MNDRATAAYQEPSPIGLEALQNAREAAVDMTDPSTNTAIREMNIRNQNNKRDDLAKAAMSKGPASLPYAVYLICTDDGACGTGEKGPRPTAKKSQALEAAASEVSVALSKGHSDSNPADLWGNLSLALSLTNQTYEGPMRKEATSDWETTTRPYERDLVQRLLANSRPISLGELTKEALDVCGNDRQKAILTLANFSKNMAAVERRQFYSSDQVAPELRSTYSNENVDNIFHRIQKLTDDPHNDYYNKEGAIYHFFGALLAGSKLGEVATSQVKNDNNQLSWLDIGRPSTDAVKDQAGLEGAKIGIDFNHLDGRPTVASWLAFELVEHSLHIAAACFVEWFLMK